MGPMSSPSRELVNGTPSHAPMSRPLDLSAEEPTASSALTKPKKGRPTNISKRNKRKGPFDLSISDDEVEPSNNDTIEPSLINGGTQDDFMPQMEDEPLEQESTMQSIEGEEPLELPTEDQVEPDATAGAMPPPAAPKSKRGRRATSKAAIPDPDDSDLATAAPETKKRGRPGRKAQVHKDTDTEQATAPKAARGKRKAPFTERDPNVKMKTARKTSKPPSRAGSVAPGSSYLVQRSETPATDSGAFTTRSGRTSIKPLATWRGERAIFEQRPAIDTLGGIREVVRIDEAMAPPKRYNGAYRKGPRRARAGTAQSLRDIEEEDEGLEPWEAESGTQQAMVMQWNPEIGKYDEDNTEQLGMYCLSQPLFRLKSTFLIPVNRNRLRSRRNRNARHPKRHLQIRKNPHPPLLRRRNGPPAPRRREAHQELP